MSDDLPYQIRELQRKYGAALQELEEKDAELEMLREATEAAAELQSQDLQGAKIIELSKKNRAMNLALEREKAKVAKLESEGPPGPSNGGATMSTLESGGPAGPSAGGATGGLDPEVGSWIGLSHIVLLHWFSDHLGCLPSHVTSKVSKLESEGPTGPSGGGAASGLNPKAVEDLARGLVEQAAEAVAAAQKDASQWKERTVQQTNKMSQLEQKVGVGPSSIIDMEEKKKKRKKRKKKKKNKDKDKNKL
eukprot:gene8752-33613_t